jgi:hypothetical protein
MDRKKTGTGPDPDRLRPGNNIDRNRPQPRSGPRSIAISDLRGPTKDTSAYHSISYSLGKCLHDDLLFA